MSAGYDNVQGVHSLSCITTLMFVILSSSGHFANGGAYFHTHVASGYSSATGKGLYYTRDDMDSNNSQKSVTMDTHKNEGILRQQKFDQQQNNCATCNVTNVTPLASSKDMKHSSTHQFYFYYKYNYRLGLKYEAVERTLDIRYTSDYTGFVTTWHHGGKGTSCGQLQAPAGHVIISFERFFVRRCPVVVTIQCMEAGSVHKTLHSIRGDRFKVIRLYNTTRLSICLDTGLYSRISIPCLKLLFSFHHRGEVPLKLGSGKYNCSVGGYWKFQQHVDCNLKAECEDGRDETEHCPFSSPACRGWVAAHNKCYMIFTAGSSVTVKAARHKCRVLGYEMAVVKSEQNVNSALTLQRNQSISALFGLACHLIDKSFMYREMLIWSDKTVVYNANHIKWGPQDCWQNHHYRLNKNSKFTFISSLQGNEYAACEKNGEQENVFISEPVELFVNSKSPFTLQQSRQTLITCLGGHLTHAFLSCDRTTHCVQAMCYFVRGERKTGMGIAHIVPMYSCTSHGTEVSYSLLCDFRQDCADNSDESFCIHPACTEFSCTNGQCLSREKRCDRQLDCQDGSDEQGCVPFGNPYRFSKYQNKNNSFLINLDGSGYFTQQVMNLTDPCPRTHYRCTKEWFYCLPIYTRCNGFSDCVFQEDERDCEGWTCPGLYRCRDSTVCVHADHMCDGRPQCPQRDDEWLCDMTCPAQCLCQGHAFLCPQPFSAHLFPQLRYLDARGSGMTPSDLKNNTYIVRLSLAKCSIRFLPVLKLRNLLHLDLGHNLIASVEINVLTEMQNLHCLILKWNPLTSITTKHSSILKNMRTIDLAGTQLDVFDSRLLFFTPGIQYINMSFSTMQSVDYKGFQIVPRLKELDIRRTTINGFVPTMFWGLNELDNIYASHYKLCCEDILPKVLPQPSCQAPQHYLSSCDNLLQSEVYRLSFWFLAVLSSLGNLVCFACHCVNSLVPNPFVGPTVVFMSSLRCADLCMGIYTGVIATAHELFRGQYFHNEDRWKESVACMMAGFLSLLSSEVSSLIIFLLTLDHLILLCYPHSQYKFRRRTAVVACGVTWFVGILLATIPLLPGLSHWGYYGQTAVCSLMLNHSHAVCQEFCFIHAILVLSIFVFLTVFICLVIVYRATPKHRVLMEQNTNPAYASVDLLMRIAVIGIARCVAVSATSLLVLAGAVGMEISVFMTVMVLPLNPAVNPLLCLWHAMTYRQRQKQEERLLNVLRSRRKYMSHATAALRKGAENSTDNIYLKE